ncbi:MAG: hypothetical protein C5B58_11815 [Acidobacteria bacterium]|nr:MAG: hypothetical protein C5B58_11815 [Acidobacteriota bacterium]
MLRKCSWPGCRAQTENWLEDGWCNYGDGDPSDGAVADMPDGFLCLHHKEAIDALDEGDIDRFLLLAEI